MRAFLVAGATLWAASAGLAQADDYPANTTTTGSISASQIVQGAIELNADRDWFRVELEAGRYYVWRAQGTAGAEVFEEELFTAAGQPLALGQNTGVPLGYVSTSAQTAYLSVRGAGISTGAYTLEMGAADDFGATTATALSTAPGRTISGSILPRGDGVDDFDWFKVDVKAGLRYDATIFGIGTDDLTNNRVCLNVYDSGGTPVTFQCSGGGTKAAVQFEASADTTAYVAAFSDGFGSGTYRVVLAPKDDYGDTQQTAGRIDPGFSVIGAITANGDEDWLKVTLSAGESYEFRMRAANSGVGTFTNGTMEIRNASGSVVASDLDGGEATIPLTVSGSPGQTGDFYVSVRSFRALGADVSSGTYLLSAVRQAPSPSTTNIFAATIPLLRSVQIGSTATFFSSIINAGADTAHSCGVAPSSPLLAPFTFQRTNASNQVVGTANERFDIPAGQTGSFVLSFEPGATFNGQLINFVFDCANTDPAPTTADVNTFTLTASNANPPDLIMIAATQSNDGVANIPGPNGTGFFTTAVINIGAPGPITFLAEAVGGTALSPLLCETNAVTGACLATLAPSVTRTLATNEIAVFSVFFAGGGQTIPFDPANRRLRFVGRDTGGAQVLRGVTGVAVRTQ